MVWHEHGCLWRERPWSWIVVDIDGLHTMVADLKACRYALQHNPCHRGWTLRFGGKGTRARTLILTWILDAGWIRRQRTYDAGNNYRASPGADMYKAGGNT